MRSVEQCWELPTVYSRWYLWLYIDCNGSVENRGAVVQDRVYMCILGKCGGMYVL